MTKEPKWETDSEAAFCLFSANCSRRAVQVPDYGYWVHGALWQRGRTRPAPEAVEAARRIECCVGMSSDPEHSRLATDTDVHACAREILRMVEDGTDD